MSLYIEVVEVVGVFGVAKVRTLQPLNDLCLHHSRDVGGQQGQQEALLLVVERRKVIYAIPLNGFLGYVCKLIQNLIIDILVKSF